MPNLPRQSRKRPTIESKRKQSTQWGTKVNHKEDQVFYNSKQWRALRLRYITRHPLCECDICVKSGLPKDGYVVDHITPRHEGGAPYDEANLQTMAESCHNRKSALERKANKKK